MNQISWLDRLQPAREAAQSACWDELMSRYPESTWAQRAEVIPRELR